MKKKRNISGVMLLLSLLISGMLISCSENAIDNDSRQEEKNNRITFSLDGLETNLTTRAAGAIDFSAYKINLLVFKRTDGSLWEGYKLDREPVKVETSLVAVDIKIEDNDKDYLYVFVAVPTDFADKLILKKGMYSPEEATIGSDYRACYIPVFNEAAVGQGASTGNYNPFPPKKEEEFMIYGWAKDIPAGMASDGIYTPQSVVLTRQLGAIEFKAPGKTITVCSVYSNFYRLYLTQMTEQKITAGVISETKDDNDITSDLVGNYPSYATNIEKTFLASSNSYRIYVPCTTLSTTVGSIPEEACANTYKGTVFGEGNGGGLTLDWNDPNNPTSVTADGITYKTLQPFPVFPNRTTVLTINDGSTIKVTFTNAGGGGIGLDDDEWNGLKKSN